MIHPQFFYKMLKENGTDFFAGVPDSLLKNFCAYLTDTVEDKYHIIVVNEGCAVALAAGHYFATGTIPLVYMQNSGLTKSRTTAPTARENSRSKKACILTQ